MPFEVQSAPPTPEPAPEVVQAPKTVVEPTGNLGQRNNNPLNITYGRETRHWVDEGKAEISGTHRFLKFYTEEDGWQACRDLLRGSYAEMTLEAAMRRWSGSGYGHEISPVNKPIAEMTEEEFETLVQNMAKREGWYAKR